MQVVRHNCIVLNVVDNNFGKLFQLCGKFLSFLMRVGDEIGALVVQLGTWYFRIGFAGDDSPKLFIRNLYGVKNNTRPEWFPSTSCVKEESVVLKEENEMVTTSSSQEPNSSETKGNSCFLPSHSNPYLFLCDQCTVNLEAYKEEWTFSELLGEDGIINDSQALCCLLKEAFTFLNVNPEENACLFVEGERGLQRETYVLLSNIVFQELSMRALFVLNHATAATFASARTTALVVCVGHKGTSVTPVVEGYTLRRASTRNAIGGEFLTRIVWKYFEEHAESVDKMNTTISCRKLDWEVLRLQRIVEDIKHSVCGLWNEKEDVVNSHGVPVEVFRYELKRGKFFEIPRELSWKIPFVLFQPCSLQQSPLDGLSLDCLGPNETREDIHQTVGICDMVVNALKQCDPDVRRELLGNILLIGCSTLFPGFTKSFEDMLSERMSPMYRIKTVSIMLPEERMYASWIGGSIVASLVTFQNFWFSREEFTKNGAEYILEKLI